MEVGDGIVGAGRRIGKFYAFMRHDILRFYFPNLTRRAFCVMNMHEVAHCEYDTDIQKFAHRTNLMACSFA